MLVGKGRTVRTSYAKGVVVVASHVDQNEILANFEHVIFIFLKVLLQGVASTAPWLVKQVHHRLLVAGPVEALAVYGPISTML